MNLARWPMVLGGGLSGIGELGITYLGSWAAEVLESQCLLDALAGGQLGSRIGLDAGEAWNLESKIGLDAREAWT